MSEGQPVCITVDLDANGYRDFVFSPALSFTQSHVVLMRAGEVVQKLEIEDSGLTPYPINPFEGDFGEPAAFHEGLVSRGSVTKVYLYDFDTQKLTVSHHATE